MKSNKRIRTASNESKLDGYSIISVFALLFIFGVLPNAFYGANAWNAQQQLFESKLVQFNTILAHQNILAVSNNYLGVNDLFEEGKSLFDVSSSTNNGRTLLAKDVYGEGEDVTERVMIKLKESASRKTFSGKKVSKEFNPQNSEYLESIGRLAVPGFTIALACIVFGIALAILGFCCGCGTKPNPDGYGMGIRVALIIILLVVAVLTIGAVIMGWVGNGRFSSAVGKFFDTVDNTTDNIVYSVGDIETQLNSLRTIDPSDIQNSIAQFKNGATSVQEKVDIARSWMKKIDRIRQAAINISLILAALTSVLALLGGILRLKPALIVAFILALIALFFLWISFGVHFPLSVLLADMCIAIDDYASNSTTTQVSPGLRNVVQCLTNDTFNLATQLINEGFGDTLNQINSVTMECCGVTYDLQNITLLNVSSIPDGNKTQVIDAKNDIDIFQTTLPIILDLGSCREVRGAYQELKHIVCDLLIKAIDLIGGAQGFIGCIFVPGALASFFAIARLPKPKKKDMYYDPNDGL